MRKRENGEKNKTLRKGDGDEKVRKSEKLTKMTRIDKKECVCVCVYRDE